MDIDWFTFFAQIINFFILLALLKHFLYNRVVAAMDQREKEINRRLEDAEHKKQEAEQEQQSIRSEKQELDAQRQELRARARREADNERNKLVQEARENVALLRKQWLDSLEDEKASFLSDLQQRTAKEVFNLSRHIFKDLADSSVEDRLVDIFVARIKAGKTDAGENLTDFVSGQTEITVRISAEPTPAMRQKITKAIQEHIARGADIVFETKPNLVMGIELRADSRKISWNVDQYLDLLEAKAREAFRSDEQAEAQKSAMPAAEKETASGVPPNK